MRDRALGIWVAVGLAAAAVLALAGSWLVGSQGRWWWGRCPMCPGGSPWMGGPGFWGGGALVMLLAMFLFWGAVIGGLVLLIRWLASQGGRRAESQEALAIARARYARGEISREAFEQLRADLADTGPSQHEPARPRQDRPGGSD